MEGRSRAEATLAMGARARVHPTHGFAATLTAVLAVCASSFAQQAGYPLGGAEKGISALSLVGASGVEASLSVDASGPNGEQAAVLTFAKKGEDRRFVGLGGPVETDGATPQSFTALYSLRLESGNAPRLALVVFDEAANGWYRLGPPATAGEWVTDDMPVGSLVPAGFNRDPASPLDWSAVRRAWLGLVLEGDVSGQLTLADARLSEEPYRATKPAPIVCDAPGSWSAGCDPAVVWTLTYPDEAPDGSACMKFEYSFPGGRHMYAVPSVPCPVGLADGYGALQFKYKATVPAGINGLLVMLGEGGAQWYAEPPPPPSEDWTTITIPFGQFQLGPWTQDDNGKLDLGKVDRVMVGLHGTAQDQAASGTIWVKDLCFAP